IKNEGSVSEGITIFLEKNSMKPRRLANALSLITQWMQGYDESDEVETTLFRLGALIRNIILRLDEEFPTRVRDPLRCDIGVLDFEIKATDEDDILDFYARHQEIRDKPHCDQCDFRNE